eukprot:457785-Alexandrium_andersonii.AAC.1
MTEHESQREEPWTTHSLACQSVALGRMSWSRDERYTSLPQLCVWLLATCMRADVAMPLCR